MTTVTVGAPNGGRWADLADFAGIWTHSSRRSARSTATAIFGGSVALSSLWPFLVAPIVGGVIGGYVARWLQVWLQDE